MSGRLFIHIGPPKTATTSLQYALAEIDHPSFDYMGVYQPRGPNIYGDGDPGGFLTYCMTGDKNYISAAQRVYIEALDSVKSGKLVVFSEEMFLVTEQHSSWRDKLSRLKEITGAIPTTILVTLRDPQDGLPSLYTEIYHALPLHMKLSYKKFCLGEYATCYNYEMVFQALTEIGFQSIRVLDFGMINHGYILSSELFGHDDKLSNRKIPIGHHNYSAQKKIGRNGTERKVGKITLKDLYKNSGLHHMVSKLNIPLSISHRFKRIFELIQVRRPTYRKFSMPQTASDAFQQGYRKALDILKDQE